MPQAQPEVRQQAQELQARLQQYRQWWMMWLEAQRKDLEADLRATGPLTAAAAEQTPDGIDGL